MPYICDIIESIIQIWRILARLPRPIVFTGAVFLSPDRFAHARDMFEVKTSALS